MKRNVSAVRFKFRCDILISGKIIKEMLGSVASGTHCTLLLMGINVNFWLGHVATVRTDLLGQSP